MPRRAAAAPVGRRIRAARQARGWTQADLAGRIDTTKQRISAIESGAVRPSLTWLLRAAAALGASPTHLAPELAGVVVDAEALARGRVTLLRSAAAPGTWTAEGTGIDGVRPVRTLDLGLLVEYLVGQGIEVVAPALPPVE